MFEKFQSGFHEHHSSETAFKGNKWSPLHCRCWQILLDLSTAFDTVDHKILLHLLSHWVGISGPALDWFCSYIRQFNVSIGNSSSTPANIRCGVLQGSVLGPLRFSVHVLLGGKIIQRHISFHCYTDDTQIYLTDHNKKTVMASKNGRLRTSFR